jgi:hypothetical protein
MTYEAEARRLMAMAPQQLRKREFRLLEAIGCGSLTDTEGNVFSAHRCDSSGC